jgi:pyruvate kinase
MAEIEEGNAERLEALVSGLPSKKRDVTIALTSPAVVALKKLDSGACSCGAPTGICALPLSFVRSVNDLR